MQRPVPPAAQTFSANLARLPKSDGTETLHACGLGEKRPFDQQQTLRTGMTRLGKHAILVPYSSPHGRSLLYIPLNQRAWTP